jgi:uncharacterized protein (DUF697 family)
VIGYYQSPLDGIDWIRVGQRSLTKLRDSRRLLMDENIAAENGRGSDDEKKPKDWLIEAKKDYDAVGGWQAIKDGEWLPRLIQKSFRNFFERSNVEYFQKKYRTTDPDKIATKLISVAAKNAAIVGAITGATVSADEITAIVTAGGYGLTLPANVAIAVVLGSTEAIALVRLQLHLVANLAKLYGVVLDGDDPEDILTILAFALGGSAAEAAGKVGMKVGGQSAGKFAKAFFAKEVLEFFKKLGKRLGVKVLQRTIVKYTIPIASIFIGTSWNYIATKAIGRLVIKHLKQRTPKFVFRGFC